jgi:hypothetical protein
MLSPLKRCPGVLFAKATNIVSGKTGDEFNHLRKESSLYF